MSTKKKKHCTDLSLWSIIEERSIALPFTLITEKLKAIYPKDHLHPFIKKINKLSMKYQMKANKSQQQRAELDKSNTSLCYILIKEIEACIDEIKRLNDKLKDRDSLVKELKENKRESDMVMIKTLKKEINERIGIEKVLKEEVKTYMRQIAFYREKLQVELRTGQPIEKEGFKEEVKCAASTYSSHLEPIVLKVNRMQNANSNSHRSNNKNSTTVKLNIANPYSTREEATLAESFITKKPYDTERHHTPKKERQSFDNDSCNHKTEKKRKKRCASDIHKSHYIQYNDNKLISSYKSRNALTLLPNKIATKLSLMNNSKNIKPLFRDINENLNKEMNLLDYEESLLHKVLSDLYCM